MDENLAVPRNPEQISGHTGDRAPATIEMNETSVSRQNAEFASGTNQRDV